MLARCRRCSASCCAARRAGVRPGGVLVYSVCSFEPEETDEVVALVPRRASRLRRKDARAWLPAEGRRSRRAARCGSCRTCTAPTARSPCGSCARGPHAEPGRSSRHEPVHALEVAGASAARAAPIGRPRVRHRARALRPRGHAALRGTARRRARSPDLANLNAAQAERCWPAAGSRCRCRASSSTRRRRAASSSRRTRAGPTTSAQGAAVSVTDLVWARSSPRARAVRRVPARRAPAARSRRAAAGAIGRVTRTRPARASSSPPSRRSARWSRAARRSACWSASPRAARSTSCPTCVGRDAKSAKHDLEALGFPVRWRAGSNVRAHRGAVRRRPARASAAARRSRSTSQDGDPVARPRSAGAAHAPLALAAVRRLDPAARAVRARRAGRRLAALRRDGRPLRAQPHVRPARSSTRSGGMTKLPLDVHLMIDEPLRYAHSFRRRRRRLLTVHAEAPGVAGPGWPAPVRSQGEGARGTTRRDPGRPCPAAAAHTRSTSRAPARTLARFARPARSRARAAPRHRGSTRSSPCWTRRPAARR